MCVLVVQFVLVVVAWFSLLAVLSCRDVDLVSQVETSCVSDLCLLLSVGGGAVSWVEVKSISSIK